jgi:hypothetical protein
MGSRAPVSRSPLASLGADEESAPTSALLQSHVSVDYFSDDPGER